VLLAGGSGLVRGEEGSPEKKAVILVRALSYDANLRQRIGDDLLLAVLTRKAGDACQASMQRGFSALGNAKVAGVPLRVIQLSYSAAEALAGAIGQQGIDVLYLCESLDPDLRVVLDVARKHQILTMAGTEDQVARGTALGVVFQESKAALLVNLTAAKSVGAAFTSDLLRVARVLR
jgi:hypothetical protein